MQRLGDAWWGRCGRCDEVARLSVTLNDVNTSILVRDAAMLELIRRGAAAEAVAACWGSAVLDGDVHAALCDALRATLAGVPWLNGGASWSPAGRPASRRLRG